MRIILSCLLLVALVGCEDEGMTMVDGPCRGRKVICLDSRRYRKAQTFSCEHCMGGAKVKCGGACCNPAGPVLECPAGTRCYDNHFTFSDCVGPDAGGPGDMRPDMLAYKCTSVDGGGLKKVCTVNQGCSHFSSCANLPAPMECASPKWWCIGAVCTVHCQ